MFKYIIEYRGAKTGMWCECPMEVGSFDTPEQANRKKEKYEREDPFWEWRVSKWEFKGVI